jgi:hypothetical protein
MWEPTNGVDFCGVDQKHIDKKFQFGNYLLWFPEGEKTYLGKFKKRWFGPFRVQYCLPSNTVFLVYVNNFEPNPISVNVNKLKPYTYVDQIMKGIQSSNNQKSLPSIDEDYMEESSDDNSKDQR